MMMLLMRRSDEVLLIIVTVIFSAALLRVDAVCCVFKCVHSSLGERGEKMIMIIPMTAGWLVN